MILESIILGENDDFLRGRKASDRPDDTTQIITQVVPDKFREDMELLETHFGKNSFESGLTIEVTLNELLSIIPRKRRRTDAYNALVKYLKDERNIVLNIKTNRKND